MLVQMDYHWGILFAALVSVSCHPSVLRGRQARFGLKGFAEVCRGVKPILFSDFVNSKSGDPEIQSSVLDPQGIAVFRRGCAQLFLEKMVQPGLADPAGSGKLFH